MFSGEMILEYFLKKYGGQRSHGIVTPADYPYIYLIHTPGKYKVDNLDVDNKGTNNIVHFAFEGNDEYVRGNKAVIEHSHRKNVYHSLLLFKLDNKLSYIGEYEYVDEGYDEETKKKYFVLNRIKPLDELEVYFLENTYNDTNKYLFSKVPTREEFFNNSKIKYKDVKVDKKNNNLEDGYFYYKM
ncbi:MAG: hypothetical protein Q4C49_13815 [Bacillota bacterium]|nr:hypothetical protein [Bacillota bacterium]